MLLVNSVLDGSAVFTHLFIKLTLAALQDDWRDKYRVQNERVRYIKTYNIVKIMKKLHNYADIISKSTVI